MHSNGRDLKLANVVGGRLACAPDCSGQHMRNSYRAFDELGVEAASFDACTGLP